MSAKLFTNPYTGVVMDFDKIGAGANGKPGKWCPATNKPLDAEALSHYDHDGVQHLSAKEAVYADAAQKVAEVAAQVAA